MTWEIRLRAWLSALAVGAIVVIGSACGGGGGGPTAPMPPTPGSGFASFRLAGAAGDEAISYSSGANLILCTRDAGFADLFIRFAEQTAANGENGRHLDIDLCNVGDGGTFAPKDPQTPSCDGGQTWGVFWHGDGATFLNQAGAPSCSLSLTRSGNSLAGTFSCQELVELTGNGTLDLLNGSFQCIEQ